MDSQKIPCTLLIKRRVSGEPGPPEFLQPGELAFNEVSSVFSVGVTASNSLSSETP
jgi:hypothetical protein